MKDFAKISDVRVGDTLIVADNHFGCLHRGQECVVYGDPGVEETYWIRCSHGQHMLDGQAGWNKDDCDQYIGLYKKG